MPEVFKRTSPQPLVDTKVLSGYSLAFYEFVVRVRPEWRHALQFASSDESGTYLYLQLPSPSTALQNLWLSTEEERVTVGFGLGELYHFHFATYAPATNAEMFVHALQFVDDFVDEKLILLIAMTGGRRGRSWVQSKDENVLIRDSTGVSQLKYDRVCVYSWNSTFDREVPV